MNKVFSAIRKGGKWVVVATPVAIAAGQAAAQTAVSTTAAESAISAQSGAIVAVGTAIIGIAVVYMIFKWLIGMVKK